MGVDHPAGRVEDLGPAGGQQVGAERLILGVRDVAERDLLPGGPRDAGVVVREVRGVAARGAPPARRPGENSWKKSASRRLVSGLASGARQVGPERRAHVLRHAEAGGVRREPALVAPAWSPGSGRRRARRWSRPRRGCACARGRTPRARSRTTVAPAGAGDLAASGRASPSRSRRTSSVLVHPLGEHGGEHLLEVALAVEDRDGYGDRQARRSR